jgi:MerR family transcriptional regulator, light-induced transcriptional regulator
MAKHSIKAVARKTGLSTYVIRAWEKRYQAVSPGRTDTNRRFYSDDDIERLIMLKMATEQGESIGQIAGLENSELFGLVERDKSRAIDRAEETPDFDKALAPEQYVEKIIAAAREIDTAGMERLLTNAVVTLSQPIFLEKVVEPLMHLVGDMWYDGDIKAVHEHAVSAVVRTILGEQLSKQQAPDSAPRIIITTPSGQLHEFGALAAAVAASSDGWDVTYLGPNMPVDDIAKVAIQRQVKAVGLSIIYLLDNMSVGRELPLLRQYLGKEVAIIIGGRGAGSYKDIIESVSGTLVSNLADFRSKLKTLRFGA